MEWLDVECSGSDIILNCLARYLIRCGVSEVMMCGEASGTHLWCKVGDGDGKGDLSDAMIEMKGVNS